MVEAANEAMLFLERWGATGLMLITTIVLCRVVLKLYGRNEELVNRHLEDKTKQIEGLAAHKTTLDKILYLVERLTGHAD